MTTGTLKGKRVAILVTNGFEQSELLEPRRALDEAGATTQVVSPISGKVKGWNHKEWGNEVPVDIPLKSANAEDFHALLLPGGVMNPDQLRMNPEAVEFVKHFEEGRQTNSRNLPRPLDPYRSRRGSRPHSHLVAFAEDRSPQRRRHLGRSRGRQRRRTRHQPQTRRHPCLQPRNDPSIQRGPSSIPNMAEDGVKPADHSHEGDKNNSWRLAIPKSSGHPERSRFSGEAKDLAALNQTRRPERTRNHGLV